MEQTAGAAELKFYNNDSVTFDDTAATSSVTLNASVQPQSVLFNNNLLTYTLSGSGGVSAASFTKTGSGMLTLNAANIASGNTTVGGGTLQIAGGLLSSSNQFVGASGGASLVQSGGTNAAGSLVLAQSAGSSGTYDLNDGLLVISAGLLQGGGMATFDFGGGTLGASVSWTSSLNMDLTGAGGKSTIDTSGGSIGLSGNLSGSGGLTKSGSGMLVLSGTNNYSGGTFVEAGELIATNSEALPDGSSLTVGNASLFPSNAPVIPAPRLPRCPSWPRC